MSYCPECGNKVSRTDKRCSKCGTKLTKDIFEDVTHPKEFVSDFSATDYIKNRKHHNIEFALTVVAVVLSVFAISQSLNEYMVSSTDVLLFICIIIFVSVIGAIITRYYAKLGSIICLITGFILVIFSVSNMFLAMVFYVLAVILAFVLN